MMLLNRVIRRPVLNQLSKFGFEHKEVMDFRKPDSKLLSSNTEDRVRSLVIHPVFYPK